MSVQSVKYIDVKCPKCGCVVHTRALVQATCKSCKNRFRLYNPAPKENLGDNEPGFEKNQETDIKINYTDQDFSVEGYNTPTLYNVNPALQRAFQGDVIEGAIPDFIDIDDSNGILGLIAPMLEKQGINGDKLKEIVKKINKVARKHGWSKIEPGKDSAESDLVFSIFEVLMVFMQNRVFKQEKKETPTESDNKWETPTDTPKPVNTDAFFNGLNKGET